MRRKRERGQSIIELAIILPLMLLIFMGVWSGAEVIGNNDSAAQVTGYAARLAASLGDDGYVSGASSPTGCQQSAVDPCQVDDAILAAIIPAMENELPSGTVTRVDIYEPTSCQPDAAGVLPSSCPTSDGALASGDLDDEYLACSGSWTAISSWKLVNASGGQSGSCPGSAGVAQYNLSDRTQNHPDEQAIGVQVTFTFSSPGLKIFTQTDTQYTAITLPPEAD